VKIKLKSFVLTFLVAAFLSACGDSAENAKHMLPEAGSQGAVIYEKFCSDCHAPPRIASHKPDEWLNIVERMQAHRIMKAYNPLTDEEKSTLLEYLKKHSK